MERLPSDPNIMPRMSIIGGFIGNVISHFGNLPKEPLASHGDHLPTTLRDEHRG